jgi:predicted ATPase
VGRESDIDQVDRLLFDRDVRLLTVIGPGGVGKTRLVQEVARQAAGDFDHGVCFVALAAVRDASLVAPTIARALGLAIADTASAVNTIIAALANKRVLLVLDNIEQVLEAAGDLAMLLEGCDFLKVVVTSREPLQLRAEQTYLLQPLEVPDACLALRSEVLERFPAVQLFTQRARAVQPTFAFNAHTARDIASVCIRLDGLPLAIELAAAQLRTISLEQLVKGIANRFTLLQGGYRDLPARQQTLRDAIQWSYDLLSSAQRVLVRHLSVFVGGFTAEAAMLLADNLNLPLSGERWDIQALVDRSLVLRLSTEPSQPARYSMLESIRDYGIDQLAKQGEFAATQHTHATWILDMASTAEPALRESDSRQWLDRLEVELGNIRAALNWSLEKEENHIGMQLASALRRFWLARGYLVEGRAWIERALARGSGTPLELQAKAMFAAGELAFFHHDVSRATELADRGLAICRSIGDTSGVPDALLGLGQLARQSGDLERAAVYLSEGISLAEVSSDIRALALLQDAMGGVLADLGDLDGALELFTRSQEYNRTVGNERGDAASFSALADIAWRRGDLDEAIDLREEALAIVRQLRDGYATATLSLSLAKMVRHQHDFTRAEHLLLEGLAVA